CGCNQYVPGCATANWYTYSDPALIGCWVIMGTPSASLRNAMPCQCTLVSWDNRLTTVTLSPSPAETRIGRPGIRPPYVQPDTTWPPRSTSDTSACSLA